MSCAPYPGLSDHFIPLLQRVIRRNRNQATKDPPDESHARPGASAPGALPVPEAGQTAPEPSISTTSQTHTSVRLLPWTVATTFTPHILLPSRLLRHIIPCTPGHPQPTCPGPPTLSRECTCLHLPHLLPHTLPTSTGQTEITLLNVSHRCTIGYRHFEMLSPKDIGCSCKHVHSMFGMIIPHIFIFFQPRNCMASQTFEPLYFCYEKVYKMNSLNRCVSNCGQ